MKPGCVLQQIERDAAAGDEEAAKVLDYDPEGVICEDCSQYETCDEWH